MKTQEAMGILMLSPCYWRMRLPQRKELIREFMASYSAIDLAISPLQNKKPRQ
jgi:hypothetical protein